MRAVFLDPSARCIAKERAAGGAPHVFAPSSSFLAAARWELVATQATRALKTPKPPHILPLASVSQIELRAADAPPVAPWLSWHGVRRAARGRAQLERVDLHDARLTRVAVRVLRRATVGGCVLDTSFVDAQPPSPHICLSGFDADDVSLTKMKLSSAQRPMPTLIETNGSSDSALSSTARPAKPLRPVDAVNKSGELC